MIRFIATLILAGFVAIFFTQNSLIYYLEQKHHSDYGLSKMLENSAFAKGGEIFSEMSESWARIVSIILGKQDEDKSITSKELQTCHDMIENFNEQNITAQLDLAEMSGEQNATEVSQNIQILDLNTTTAQEPPAKSKPITTPKSDTNTTSTPKSVQISQPSQAIQPTPTKQNSPNQPKTALKSDQNRTKKQLSQWQTGANRTDKLKLKKGETMLFIGDSMMQYVGMNARKFYPQHGIKVVDLSKQSTGLISKKVHNWNGVLENTLKENASIKILAVLIGANDPWGNTINGRSYAVVTPQWQEFYAERVSEIYETARKYGVSVIWMSLPCMQERAFDDKISILNQIYRSVNAKYSQYFIDTSELVCENNSYKSHLQIGGTLKRIRSADGIHMNKDGCKIVSDEILKRIEIE